jgi:CheY-like chemotaxis protein
MQLQNQELVNWTHEALKHLYDQPFLERHCRAPVLNRQFADGHALQEALSRAVKQLRPSVQVPAHAPAWRIYNVLNLRYVQGLTQSEVADHLNIGSRQLRREQWKVTEAVAAMLFEQTVQAAQIDPAAAPQSDPTAAIPSPTEQMDVIRMDELLLTTLRVLDPLLQRQDLHITVTSTGGLLVVRANRMILRQMLISALNWWINGLAHCKPAIHMDVARGKIHIRLLPCGATPGAASEVHMADPADARRSSENQPASDKSYEPFMALRGLAEGLPAELSILDTHAGRRYGGRGLEITLPACEMECVILIDDNQDAVQLVRRYLHQSSEFYLIAITHAEDAFQQVLALHPACILLDVMMPERDGWELLTLFKTHPGTASIPIIVSSVLKEDELALALGAAATLPKPFNALQLSTTLRTTIACSRQTPAASTAAAPQPPASVDAPAARPGD